MTIDGKVHVVTRCATGGIREVRLNICVSIPIFWRDNSVNLLAQIQAHISVYLRHGCRNFSSWFIIYFSVSIMYSYSSWIRLVICNDSYCLTLCCRMISYALGAESDIAVDSIISECLIKKSIQQATKETGVVSMVWISTGFPHNAPCSAGKRAMRVIDVRYRSRGESPHSWRIFFTWMVVEIERGITDNYPIDPSITRNSTRDTNQVSKY